MPTEPGRPNGHISDQQSLRTPTSPEPLGRVSAIPEKSHAVRNWLIVLSLLGLVGFGIFRVIQSREAARQKAEGAGRGAQMPVPVVAGIVKAKDVSIYLDGLGTVQALNTVTVRARVDGQLDKIAFKEGQDVKAGDLLVQLDPAPLKAALEQAEARQRQDQVQLANAQRDAERNVDLLAKKVIAQQEFDTQKSLTAQYEAAVKNDAAAVESAKVQLSYATIVSPIPGRVGIRQVDEGNLVRANDQNGIVTITQLQPIALLFTLPQQNLPPIQKELNGGAELGVLAVASDNKTVLDEGKLAVIDNQIDAATGTIKMKAVFPNAEHQLWPGQFTNARLHLTTRKGGLVVPASVIQRGPEGAYVFVIKADETVENRPVKVAQIEDGEALLDEGLSAGERVVVDGQYRLQPGSKVKIAEPVARPGAGGANGKPAASER